MHFVQDTWSGRICLLLGLVLLVWGACREPMLPTRQVVIDLPVGEVLPRPRPVSLGEEDGAGDELVIVRNEEKAGR